VIFRRTTFDLKSEVKNETMRSLIPAVLILAATPTLCFAQANPGPSEDAREVQIWTAAGHSVPGGTARTGVFNAGLRYGWILTGPHLPSIFRGRFEYAVDAVPLFLVFQPANTAYGVGFSPLGLKWNFERHGRLLPYFELGGGALFTDHKVPAFTNRVNFTPSAALGTHILGAKYNWSLEVRYLHISNAGLSRINPGLNTVEFRLGIGKFFGGHP
jgi:hypothetical protein